MNSIPWNRINTALLLLVLLAIIGLFASRAYGGPLDPPSAPGPTDGVREPGTPISSLPFTISAPGRYYLTTHLTGPVASSGITIAADDVTLDLHGFTLTSAAGGVDGVLVSGAHANIQIANGAIRGWFNGIDASTATYSSISRVSVLDGGIALGDGGYGILVGANARVDDCVVSNNKNNGVHLGQLSVMRRCLIAAQGGDGVVAEDGSTIEDNQFAGNGHSAASASLAFVGDSNIVRGNSFVGGYRDIRLKPAVGLGFSTVVDNAIGSCNSIDNIKLQDFVPLHGEEHSNFVRVDGYTC